ncbi:EscU/YscU/HrcU family type III secretion system export apparatus switch protein [Ilumatobacter sp.]|uniref:EscU/YscU/HrcU family type III secretion system export apparatus switch protein n=1 Tax=Ilumatobacter sp. TaxID=1967498 RepID=UPI003B52385F
MAKSDKTEQATPKRKRDSRRKGQIAKSQDLTAWLGVLVGLYLVPMTVGRLADVGRIALDRITEVSPESTPETTVAMLGSTLRSGFVAAAPLMAVAFAVTLVATLAQTGPLLTLKPLVPDFKRVNPKNGIQRLVSPRSVWETGKQLLKISIVIGVAWPQAVDLVEVLAGRGRLALSDALPAAGAEVLGLVRGIAWTMVVLSVADYGYQRFQHGRDMKMSKQEVKDEYKNAEGDGSVKGRMRQMARSMARNRMIADMGDADVIITNPTHIAVALKYDPLRGGAPRVLAVGAGSLAARIRERALDAGIPMVEAKPLARALWRACDVGDEVPVVLYEAVAKVLVFVRQLDSRIRRSRSIDLPRRARVDETLLESVPKKRRRR